MQGLVQGDAVYREQAFHSLAREYLRGRELALANHDNGNWSAVALSVQFTAARERYLSFAFHEAFKDLIERYHIALCVSGGTASKTTAQFSDLDIFLVSLDDLSGKPDFGDALQRFRDILQRDKFHFDLQYYDAGVSFDTTSVDGIPSKERRDKATIKLAETYLSLLPARCIEGSPQTFRAFQDRYAASLREDGMRLLRLWHRSVSIRWDEFPEPSDSVDFDVKGSLGALRECDTLMNLKALVERAEIPNVFILPYETSRMLLVREELLRLKHQMHFLHSGDSRLPNPEDRKFTACTFTKLQTITGAADKRELILARITEAREALSKLATRVHRRVGDFLESSPNYLERSCPLDTFGRAYSSLREECCATVVNDQNVVKKVLELFGAWKEKLGPVDARKVSRSLSTLEHEALEDLSDLAKIYIHGGLKITPQLAAVFRSIIEMPGPRAPIFELMYRSDWLQLLIPEWRNAETLSTGKVDDPVTHARHALETVRMLDLLLGQFGTLPTSHPYSGLAHAFIEQPEALYLAALSHDFGYLSSATPQKKGHEERGALCAYKLSKSLGYSDNDSYRVSWLVANHHRLKKIAQQSSLDEQALGARVRAHVLDPDSLTMLYALTAADRMAHPRHREDLAVHGWIARAFVAGSKAMNLSGESRDNELLKRRIAQDYSRCIGVSTSVSMERLEEHLKALPNSYLSELSAEEVVQHLVGVSKEDLPFIHWIHEGNVDEELPLSTRLQRVVVVARDQSGLLSRMCGGVIYPITEARVFTRKDGYACNVITLRVPRTMLSGDLIRYSARLRDSLCQESLMSEKIVAQFSRELERAGRTNAPLTYDVAQEILENKGAHITIKGPDRRHLASVIAGLFPGIESAKFSQGEEPGTVRDSLTLSERLSAKALRQIARALNHAGGVLPPESP